MLGLNRRSARRSPPRVRSVLATAAAANLPLSLAAVAPVSRQRFRSGADVLTYFVHLGEGVPRVQRCDGQG